MSSPPAAPPIVSLDEALWPAALDIWVEAWQAAYPAIDFEARRPWLCERRRENVAQGWLWRAACAESGAVLGFYSLDFATGDMDQIVVALQAWGHGVGAALLDDAKALRPSGLTLTVNESNARAIAFYEKHGFRRGAGAVNGRGQPVWRYAWP